MDRQRTDDKLALVLGDMFELRLSGNDIRKCDPDVVQKIYVHFLREMGASLEQINEVPFCTSESVQLYPDMYRSSMRLMRLARVIRFILHNLYGDDSFMSADLYDPKPKRTRQFFWMMSDYFNVKNIFVTFDDLEEQVGILHQKCLEMQGTKERLREKVHQLRLEKAEFKIQEEEEEKRVMAEKFKLHECQERKIELKNRIEELKVASSAINTAIKEDEVQVIQDGELVKELESQVVQDSERVEIEHRDGRLADLRIALGEKKERVAQLQHSLATLDQERDTLSFMMATFKDLNHGINKDKETRGAEGPLDQAISAAYEETEDKALHMHYLNQQLESQMSKISQVNQTWKINYESILEEIKQLKQTLEECRRNKTESEIAYKDMENECSHLTLEITQFKEQIININNFIASSYQRILAAMENKNSNLQTILTEVVEAIQHLKK